MAQLPVNMKTTAYVMESRVIPQTSRREYLGMSGIGGKCLRAMWYGFHWATPLEELPIRTKRIFDRGDIEEARIIKELKEVGMKVFKEVDGERIELIGTVGEEQEELIGFAGHCKGHPDGRVIGVIEAPDVVHLLELKTAKAAKFKEFTKNGVMIANPTYYGQAQRYMDKMGLKRCLFIVTNKDTEERYYERIRFDNIYAKELARREVIVVTSGEPPEKLSQNKNWMDCRWCKAKDICHNGEEPEQNCRTCEFADISDGGAWHCLNEKNKRNHLTYHEQEAGCKYYQKGWGL